MKPSMPIKKE